MSPLDKLKSVKGEANQGGYLVNAKERHSEKKNHRTQFNKRMQSNASCPSSASKNRQYMNDYMELDQRAQRIRI